MNTSPRDTFYQEVIAETGFTKKRIKSILKGRFDTFEIPKIDEYKEVILGIHRNEQEQAATERVQNYTPPDPVPCPMCEAPTIGDHSLDGSYTKERGWRCTKGGSNHYWQYRAQKSWSARKEIINVTKGNEGQS